MRQRQRAKAERRSPQKSPACLPQVESMRVHDDSSSWQEFVEFLLSGYRSAGISARGGRAGKRQKAVAVGAFGSFGDGRHGLGLGSIFGVMFVADAGVEEGDEALADTFFDDVQLGQGQAAFL